MLNFKAQIAEKISNVIKISKEELETYIEIPKDTKNGDYSFPCFKLAKDLKKAPPVIANEIKEKLDLKDNQKQESIIKEVEIVGGYLNFYINKDLLTEQVLKQIAEKEEYGKSEIGKGKNIVIDYSAPNIAKPFNRHKSSRRLWNSIW